MTADPCRVYRETRLRRARSVGPRLLGSTWADALESRRPHARRGSYYNVVSYKVKAAQSRLYRMDLCSAAASWVFAHSHTLSLTVTSHAMSDDADDADATRDVSERSRALLRACGLIV